MHLKSLFKICNYTMKLHCLASKSLNLFSAMDYLAVWTPSQKKVIKYIK